MAIVTAPWLQRETTPDLYPRNTPTMQPGGAIAPVTAQPDAPPQPGSVVTAQLTAPGMRPTVTQRALNYGLTVAITATSLMNQRLEVDAILIDNPSTAANSIWLGFGSSITVGTGIEIQPGSPFIFSPNNGREHRETQRVAEFMAAIKAIEVGIPPLPAYKAPRVVLNASDWFLIALASTNISLMLFFIPEQQ